MKGTYEGMRALRRAIGARYLEFAELVARCPWPLLRESFYDAEDGCMCGLAALAVYDGLANIAVLSEMETLVRRDIYWWHTGVTSPLTKIRDLIADHWWVDADTIVDISDRPHEDDASDARRRLAEWMVAWAIEKRGEDEELAQDHAWAAAQKKAKKIVAGWIDR